MGLFDKKYCDICGAQIKLLGNKKLEDGNCCKDCADKLSPWFSGRRHNSVAATKEQIEYREANKADVAKLNPTATIGKRYKVYIDKTAKKFAVSPRNNWREANPDVLSLSQIKDVKIVIDEDRDEVYDKDENGKRISFDPPQYTYKYSFNVDIDVDHKYFDDMDFQLFSELPDSPESDLFKEYVNICKELMKELTNKEWVPDYSAFTYEMSETEDDSWKCPKCSHENSGNFCSKCGEPKPADDIWYCPNCGTKNESNFCSKCGNAKPSKTVFCSKCGNKLDGDAAFCPKCGTKVN